MSSYLRSRVKMAGTPGNINYGIQTGSARGTAEAARLVNKYVKLVREAHTRAESNKHYSNFETNLKKIYNKEAKEFANLARQVANKGRSPARPPRPPRMTPTAAQMRNNIIRNLRVRLANLERARNRAQNAVNRKKHELNGILALHQRA